MAAVGADANDNNGETESSQVPASVSASTIASDLGLLLRRIPGKYLSDC